MADPIKVCKGDTQEVLDTFKPDTTEADLWREFVTPRVKGRLLRSSGIQVTQGSTAKAVGHYHFHAFGEAGGQQSQAGLHRHQHVCSMVCFRQTAQAG